MGDRKVKKRELVKIIGGVLAICMTSGAMLVHSTSVNASSHQAYSSKRSNNVKLVWRKSMGWHAMHTTQGALYSKHLGYKYANMSAYPNTTWYTMAHEKFVRKSTGTKPIYYRVVSADGKHNGWIYRGYLKKGASQAVTPKKNQANPNSNVSSAIPKTPATKSSKNLENTLNIGLYRVAFMKKLNQERAKAGVAPATEDSALDSLAEVRAPQAAKNYSHVDSKGNFIALDLAEKMGITNFTGETLMQGDLDGSDDSISFSARADVETYLCDDAHSNIVLGAKNTHVGLGIAALPDDSRQYANAAEFGN